jgi:uncharacterized protein YlaI
MQSYPIEIDQPCEVCPKANQRIANRFVVKEFSGQYDLRYQGTRLVICEECEEKLRQKTIELEK